MFGSIGTYIRLAIGVVFVALVALCIYFYQRSEIAVLEKESVEQELTKALGVNKKNQDTIKQLRELAEQDRRATEKEIADTQARASAIDQIKKEMDDVEGADAPAGAYWDAFSERLRSAKRSH